MSTATQPGDGSGEDGGLRRGDHIRAGQPGNAHHDGIYLGDGRVVHLTGGPGGGKAGAHVRIDTLAVFAAGRPVTVKSYSGDRDTNEIIARAMSRLGKGNYHLIRNNCQHFAHWCVTGDHESEQVRSVAATAGTIAAPATAAALTTSLVGSAGLVAGVSGPGIMSGLAAYGAVLGGGAVAGITVLGTAPALASVAIMHYAFRRDSDLPRTEQTARAAGRIGAAAGALGGGAASIAAVSALGVPGLSAAGISSGLAAIGAAAAGGGMAAGTICAVAAPAAIAAIAGYLIYRLALWLAVRPSPTPATSRG
jgi:hypothetical protein